MKLIVIEGGENVGKTTLVKKLKVKYGDKISYAKFPSPELMNKYKDVVTRNTSDLKYNFIQDLIGEELNELNNKNIVLIDRFHLSTLVYQGDISIGVDDYILDKYLSLYVDLNIDRDDVKTFILTKEYPMNTNEERTDAQKINDENSVIINEKYIEVLKNLDSYSDLGSFKIFSDNDYVVFPKYIHPFDMGHVVKNADYIFNNVSSHIDKCLVGLDNE